MLLICRFVSDFAALYQPIIIAVFLQSPLTLCCVMLIIQIELVEFKSNRSFQCAIFDTPLFDLDKPRKLHGGIIINRIQ